MNFYIRIFTLTLYLNFLLFPASLYCQENPVREQKCKAECCCDGTKVVSCDIEEKSEPKIKGDCGCHSGEKAISALLSLDQLNSDGDSLLSHSRENFSTYGSLFILCINSPPVPPPPEYFSI